MTTASIYVRVSSNQQEQDGTSLDTQLERNLAHAAAHGYTVDPAHIYREVHTGVELWQRPKLTALREAVRRREIDVVICYAIDRLSRDPVHLGVIISEADHARVAVEFVTEPLDNSPEGQLIRFVRGYAAKVEHEKIRERMIRSRQRRIEQGKPLAGPRPRYGYRWRDEGKTGLVIDPLTGPIVQRIFREALAGSTLRAITAGINADGIAPPSGRCAQWDHTTVRNILADERYTGVATALRWQRVKERGERSFTRLRPDGGRVPLPDGTIPPLVSDADFHAIAARLRQNKAGASRRANEPERFLLRAGFIHCALCGHTMTVWTRTEGTTHYRCALGSRVRGACQVHTIAARHADERAWSKVRHILTTRGLIARELERRHGEDPTEADVAAVDRALAEVAKRQAGLARTAALVADDDAAAPLAALLAELSARKRALDAERADLIAQRGEWQITRRQLADLDAWCEAMGATLDELDYPQRRQVLHALGVDVRVAPGGVVDVVTAITLPSVGTTPPSTSPRRSTATRS